MSKGWWVYCAFDRDQSDLVLADTAGQAKAKSWLYLMGDVDFIDLNARREPGLDGMESVNDKAAWGLGYLVRCASCGEWVLPDEGHEFAFGRVYHRECLEGPVVPR